MFSDVDLYGLLGTSSRFARQPSFEALPHACGPERCSGAGCRANMVPEDHGKFKFAMASMSKND